MDIKVESKKKKVDAPYGISIGLFTFATMIFNCIMCICFCYLAWSKGWWATLLLIPCCILSPSFESTPVNSKEDNKDE